MFDAATLGTFIAVVLGLFLIPGPAVLLVLTRTAQGGRKLGIFTGLGIALGDLVHTLGAAVGLSAILMTSALAFNAVKLVGAAYLVYLGVRALTARPAAPTDAADGPAGRIRPPLTAARAFWQAVPVEVLNPKTALFFLAFLPQFVDPARAPAFVQFAVLGLIFVALSVLYTTVIAVAAVPLGRLVKRLRWLRRWQNTIIGVIFISLGLKVATQSR